MDGAENSVQTHFFDDHRPRCHLAPPAGWLNDPNGPVYYKGRYHMFYQHLPNACEWDFGIVWGHAVSTDLVHWQHLPPALMPTPGWVDADGCFSGCCLIDPSGRPVILYTGVRLRSNASAGPLPPPEQDLGMVWIESQCAAVPEDPNDELLIRWKKIDTPILPLPPPHMELTGWRDPFIFTTNTLVSGGTTVEAPHSAFHDSISDPRRAELSSSAEEKKADDPTSHEFRILMGSGIRGKGGTALVYKSKDIMHGWELEGTLCEGNSEDTGIVWECPLLVPLMPVPYGQHPSDRTTAPAWLHQAHGKANNNSNTLDNLGREGKPTHSWTPALGNGTNTVTPRLTDGPEVDPMSMTDAHTAKKTGIGEQGTHKKEGVAEFNFDSADGGIHSPDQRNISHFDEQGSIDIGWPSSADISPNNEPKNGQNREKSGDVTIQANDFLMEALSAKLERAATLEHWNAVSNEGTELPPYTLLKGEEHGNDDGGALGREKALKLLPLSSDPDGSEDRFAMAFSRVPALQVKPPSKQVERSHYQQQQFSSIHTTEMVAQKPPERQWHFFTVSPDAPTNPVLYWTGFMSDSSKSRDTTKFNKTPTSQPSKFEIDTAKGPYRLDLGDILYAPNACQDASGRWILWGWLQERRKMGSYSYAGCLSLPRILHVTSEGRLVQAPAPELIKLRQGNEFHANYVTLYPESILPIQKVSGDRLDIEVTIERGSAMASGLLFRSHEAEAEGSTAIVYDWDRNQLEAIFNVPPNWQPIGIGPALRRFRSESDVFDDYDESTVLLDAAAYLSYTPKFSLSRTHSLNVFSVESTPRAAAVDITRNMGALASPLGTTTATPLSSVSCTSTEDLASTTSQVGGVGVPIQRQGSSLQQCLTRSNSNVGLATSVGVLSSSQPLPPPSRPGSYLQRQSSFIPGTPRSQAVFDTANAAEMEAELSTLLEDLAAPMRGATGATEEVPVPPPEPRRVGGPLLMRPSDKLHLRIFVDHSCVEVFTGTGEVLSTRIYRGKQPKQAGNEIDSGIEFVAFGGAAVLEKLSAYEVGSAWKKEHLYGEDVGTDTADFAKTGDGEPSPTRPDFVDTRSGHDSNPVAMEKSPGERANDLFDEIVVGI